MASVGEGPGPAVEFGGGWNQPWSFVKSRPATSSGEPGGLKVKAEPASVPDGAPKLKEGRDGPPAAEAAVKGAEGPGGFIAAPRPCDA